MVTAWLEADDTGVQAGRRGVATLGVPARGNCGAESNCLHRIAPRRSVPVSARSPIGRATKAYCGAGQCSSMNATPNNALQRTRVRPAGGRSPLSFETLDDRAYRGGEKRGRR